MSNNDSNKPVYITAAGSFLPGPRIENDEMESYLGEICGKPSRLRERMLRQNGIHGRHYAIDREQHTTYQNYELATNAVRAALNRAAAKPRDLGLLVAATSQGDLPIPGFGSMIHGELGEAAVEAVTHHGVCASGLAAIKTSHMNIQTGAHDFAVAVASELPSRLFKASRYESQAEVACRGRLDSDAEFLRWMLSDGAGAVVMRDRPAERGLSLKVDWIQMNSHAHRFPVCMYVGGSSRNHQTESWLDAPDYQDAAHRGLINLRQDLRQVDHIVSLGVTDYLKLVDSGEIVPDKIDHMLCHFSSACFLDQIQRLAEQAGAMIPQDRWSQVMFEKGNVGSASLYLMLDDLLQNGDLKAGQQVLCMVPESGRFTTGFMKLTVAEASDHTTTQTLAPVKAEDNLVPADTVTEQIQLRQSLMRKLLLTWQQFEADLEDVPFVDDLLNGRITLAQYMALLRDLRAQVVQGANWISRAVSSIEPKHVAFRNTFLQHAGEEHLDYQMLERDYVQCGGQLEDIVGREPNLGSEALAAFIMHRASQPNPWDMLGVMFIIEGLGLNMATHWSQHLMTTLKLAPEQITFLRYHGEADEAHTEKLHDAISALDLTPELVARIVRTAEMTARLYRLQLSEIEV